ncbi:MAG: hypothetical protein H2042_03855 [Rhizobiales bacterium]|nr:hypothetical protein [Hyphomicrobiales bacterium]
MDEALEETFPASDPPAQTNPTSFTGAEMPPDVAQAREKEAEDRKLDEELEDSFPASDPPALTNPSSFTGAETPADDRTRDDRKLDEELKQTFPASDPPTVVRKHRSGDV